MEPVCRISLRQHPWSQVPHAQRYQSWRYARQFPKKFTIISGSYGWLKVQSGRTSLICMLCRNYDSLADGMNKGEGDVLSRVMLFTITLITKNVVGFLQRPLTTIDFLQRPWRPSLQTEFTKKSRYNYLVLGEVGNLVLNLSISTPMMLSIFWEKDVIYILARPSCIILWGEGGACAASTAGTYGAITAGCLPLAMAATSATEEEEATFLSVEKKRKC